MVTRTEIRDAALVIALNSHAFLPLNLPYQYKDRRIVNSVLEELKQEGIIKAPEWNPSLYCLAVPPEQILVGGLSSVLRLQSAVCNPGETAGEWELSLLTTGGEVRLRVDELAAYDLRDEVSKIPDLPV